MKKQFIFILILLIISFFIFGEVQLSRASNNSLLDIENNFLWFAAITAAASTSGELSSARSGLDSVSYTYIGGELYSARKGLESATFTYIGGELYSARSGLNTVTFTFMGGELYSARMGLDSITFTYMGGEIYSARKGLLDTATFSYMGDKLYSARKGLEETVTFSYSFVIDPYYEEPSIICPLNSTKIGDNCYCNSGYKFNANQTVCEKIITDTTPPMLPSSVKVYSDSSKTKELNFQVTNTDNSPYFEWSGAYDAGGIAGYYVYFGKDKTALITDGSFQTANNYSPTNITSDGDYYLQIATLDKAKNVSDQKVTYTYSYSKLPAPIKPSPIDVTFPMKIANIAEYQLDICWNPYIASLESMKYGANTYKIAFYESTDNKDYYSKYTIIESQAEYKYLPGENKRTPCYTINYLYPDTTYYFKVYVIFEYTNASVQSDSSRVISATTLPLSKPICPENSTFTEDKCICNQGYVTDPDWKCETYDENCKRFHGENAYAVIKQDDNWHCSCKEGYEWSGATCIKKTEPVQQPPLSKQETIPTPTLSGPKPETRPQSVEPKQEESKEQPKEEIKEPQKENQQQETSQVQEQKPKKKAFIFLANTLIIIKDFFVSLFGFFK